MPATGSLDTIGRDATTADHYVLWVPYDLTLHGEPVPHDVAMAVLGDALLCAGLMPDGFVERDRGREYRFKSLDCRGGPRAGIYRLRDFIEDPAEPT